MKCPTASGVDTPRKLVFGWNRLKTHLKSLIYVPVAIYFYRTHLTAQLLIQNFRAAGRSLASSHLCCVSSAADIVSTGGQTFARRMKKLAITMLWNPKWLILCAQELLWRVQGAASLYSMMDTMEMQPTSKKGQVTPSNHWISIGLIPQNPPDV